MKPTPIDYEDNDEMTWIQYLDENLFHRDGKESPFPGSDWSYVRSDSHFDKEDALKRSDEDLKYEVLHALYNSEKVDASQIHVDVLNGHVLLSGIVSSEEARRDAEEVVKTLKGVWSIENKLTVMIT